MFVAELQKYWPQSNVEIAATGEHWTAEDSQALNLGLVDEVGTSATYLLKKNEQLRLVAIKSKKKFLEEGLFATLFGESLSSSQGLQSVMEKFGFTLPAEVLSPPRAEIENRAVF